MKKYNICLIFLVIFLTNCNKETIVKEGVLGEFAVLDLFENGVDLTSSMGVNFIEFKDDGKLIIPRIYDRYKEGIVNDSIVDGKWKLIENNKKYEVIITTKNHYFNGRFEVVFDKTETGNLYLILRNDKFHMVAEKSAFDFRRKQSLINDLIKYTNSEPTVYEGHTP